MPWEGGAYGRGNNVGNTRLKYSFIFELCPGEISPKHPWTRTQAISQARKFPTPACPPGLWRNLEEERRGVGWATLNSSHMSWSPVGSGTQTKALSQSKKDPIVSQIPPTRVFGQHP